MEKWSNLRSTFPLFSDIGQSLCLQGLVEDVSCGVLLVLLLEA